MKRQEKRRFHPWIAAILVVTLLAGIGTGVFLLNRNSEKGSVTESQPSQTTTPMATEISLWVSPIGKWMDKNAVQPMLDAFRDETGITVNVRYYDEMSSQVSLSDLIARENAPDLVMDDTQHLVMDYGATGIMVDLSDMLDATDISQMESAALNSCYGADGKLYEYPLAMTVHSMAINKRIFEAADAMEHLNAETHTWNSVEDFFQAMVKVTEYMGKPAGTIYCGNRSGDQGTRALVTNLSGGAFINDTHTQYTWDSAENIEVLTRLYNSGSVTFDASMAAINEICEFYNGNLGVAFCWNIAQQQNPYSAGTGAEMTKNGDDILFMAFPSDETIQLEGVVWGFGIVDNGDAEKVEAAKAFIRYFCDSEATLDAVRNTQYFPVRSGVEGATMANLWADNSIMQEYSMLIPYLGDCYAGAVNWNEARDAWIHMLQEIGRGYPLAESVKYWCNIANAN